MSDSKGILGGLFGKGNSSIIIIIIVLILLFSGNKRGFRLFEDE